MRPLTADLFALFPETLDPRHDGGGERDPAPPGDRSAVAGREEVPAGGGKGRCGVHQTVRHRRSNYYRK